MAGGARCNVHYHATHSSLEHQTLAWTLAFAKQHEAATWVSVLRLPCASTPRATASTSSSGRG